VASFTGTGILISKDAGRSWKLVDSADTGAHPFAGQGFSSILIDPNSPNILLASTGFGTDPNFPYASLPQGNPGFQHLGIYRSTDAGDSWTQAMSASYGRPILPPGGFFHTDLLYEPMQGSYFAGVSQQGIFVSNNQGKTWNSLPRLGRGQGLPNGSQISRISLATRNGSLWALLLMAPFATSNAFQLFQSDDQGGSWRQLALPSDPPPLGHFKGALMYVAAPPNSNALLFATQFLYRTDDIRAPSPSWFLVEKNLHGDQHAIAFVDADKWYVGDDGGAWATTNGGGAWTSLNDDLRTLEVFSADEDLAGGGSFAGGAQDNGPVFTTGGPDWKQMVLGDGMYVAADPQTTGAFFLSQGGDIFYAPASNPSNLIDVINFTRPPPVGRGLAADFLTPYEILPTDSLLYNGVSGFPGFNFAGSRILLAGANDPWLIAFDPDAPHSPTDPGPPAVPLTNQNSIVRYIAPIPGDPSSAYFTAGPFTSTSLFRLTNISFRGNATVTSITGGPVNGDVLGPLAVSTSQCLYLVKPGFLQQKIFKSPDGGNSWLDISGDLPNVPVNWLTVDPNDPNVIYVATNVGVYTAVDGGIEGEQWQILGQGLPDVPVMQLKITRARKLIAATYGRGVWAVDLPFPPPRNCSVMILACGAEASMVCDAVSDILFFGARKSFLQPAPDFMPGGFTLPTPGFGANVVYDAPIELGDNEFEACSQEQDSPFRRSCVWPIPFSGPDLFGCPGHPAPPLPKPSQCLKEGCRPRPGGGCICE
jgi:photosystem II stability/assembly factor-like uncharacterized protein